MINKNKVQTVKTKTREKRIFKRLWVQNKFTSIRRNFTDINFNVCVTHPSPSLCVLVFNIQKRPSVQITIVKVGQDSGQSGGDVLEEDGVEVRGRVREVGTDVKSGGRKQWKSLCGSQKGVNIFLLLLSLTEDSENISNYFYQRYFTSHVFTSSVVNVYIRTKDI